MDRYKLRMWAFVGVVAAANATDVSSDAHKGSCAAGTGGWAHNTRNILPDIVFIAKLTDPAACCEACVAHADSHGCQAWTSNVSGCGLKHASWEKGGYSGSTSGTVAPSPRPPQPPPPPPHPGPPPPPLPPPPPAPPGTCKLTESGPIVVSRDGQVVENMRIVTTTKQPGIYIVGRKNVMIRNCTIEHRAQTVWPFGNGNVFTVIHCARANISSFTPLIEVFNCNIVRACISTCFAACSRRDIFHWRRQSYHYGCNSGVGWYQ